jgi:hypothetical protein
MPERPVVRDDAPIEHPPPAEPSPEPHGSADDTDDDVEHQSHDPYQPL